MTANTAVMVINSMIILAITAISIAGFLVSGTTIGLWSMLMLFGMCSTNNKNDTKES